MAKQVADSVKKLLTTSSTAPQRDSSQPREVPAPATPVQLPQVPPQKSLGAASYTAQEIAQLFLTIHKTGPTIGHIQALNIGPVTEVALEQLLPKDHLPPQSWLEDPSTTGGSSIFPASLPSSITLSNGAAVPDHDIYFSRVKELLVDNEDAFRFLGRLPARASRPTVRIAQFRKFWDGLSQISDYWDTSLDQYTNNTLEASEEAMEADQSLLHRHRHSIANRSAEEDEKGSKSIRKQTYTGRRLGTGKDMPPKYRDDTVFSFIETIAFAFRCRVEKPRIEPKIKLHNLLIPLAQTATIFRYPRDSQLARRGIMEGPLMAIQCSNQTVFNRPEEMPGHGQGEIANLLREVGSMLSVAQKRSREDQKEPEPSQGQWWVNKPRWGGGPGGEICELEEIQEPKEAELKLPFVQGLVDEGNTKGETTESQVTRLGRIAVDRQTRRYTREYSEGSIKGRKRTKKSNAINNWKNLQSAPSTWEKNIIYKRVGKDKSSALDDVNLAPLNHQIYNNY